MACGCPWGVSLHNLTALLPGEESSPRAIVRESHRSCTKSPSADSSPGRDPHPRQGTTMTMKLTHTQRTRFGRDRDRRIGRITEVAPATSVVRPPVAISPADPLGAAREARLHAERQLRRSELERDQTARALELNLSPMALDEAGANVSVRHLPRSLRESRSTVVRWTAHARSRTQPSSSRRRSTTRMGPGARSSKGSRSFSRHATADSAASSVGVDLRARLEQRLDERDRLIQVLVCPAAE